MAIVTSKALRYETVANQNTLYGESTTIRK